MAEINYSAVSGHIASGKPSPVYLICGDDGYLRRRSLEMLKEKYKPDILPEFNYTEFDGADHGVWDRVYENTDNIRWLFSQSLEERRKTAEKSSQIKKLAAAGGIAGALVSVLIAVFVEKNRKKGKSTKNKK